jgi:hypothetical protein
VKTSILSVAFAVALAAAAQAQVTVEYERRSRNSHLTLTYSSGLGYGYNYGGYGGYGGFGGYGGYGGWGSSYYGGGSYPGYFWSDGPSYYSYGGSTYYNGPVLGSPGAYYAGYGNGYRGGYGRPYASTDVAGPVNRSGPVADRIPEFAAAREIEEGKRRLKLGDYRGAVDQFRTAVTEQTDSPLSQGWFAVALAIAGEGRNADKALRAAASGGLTADRILLADSFRDEKEKAKVAAALSKTGAEGGLAAGFVLDRMGDSSKLKQMAEKDPVARQLLPR